jgi:hypothetical protein
MAATGKPHMFIVAEQVSNWILVWEELLAAMYCRRLQITGRWWDEELSLENDWKKTLGLCPWTTC